MTKNQLPKRDRYSEFMVEEGTTPDTIGQYLVRQFTFTYIGEDLIDLQEAIKGIHADMYAACHQAELLDEIETTRYYHSNIH